MRSEGYTLPSFIAEVRQRLEASEAPRDVPSVVKRLARDFIDGYDRSQDRDEPPAAVYWLYNREGDLLYIGCTEDPIRRFEIHNAQTPWFSEVAVRDVRWFDGLQAARNHEAREIEDRNPRENEVSGKGGRGDDPDGIALIRRLSVKGVKVCGNCGKPSHKYLRGTRCHTCYEYHRNHGVDRHVSDAPYFPLVDAEATSAAATVTQP